MKHLIISIICIFYFSACSIPGGPGYISRTESAFDGSTQLKMEPAWIPYAEVKLGLFTNTKIENGDIILTVIVKGAHNFDSGESLLFNVDGKVHAFTSRDELTEFSTTPGSYGNGVYISGSNWSSKDYKVSRDFINEIVGAEKVIIKINLRKSYIEGEFSSDAPTTARPAFKAFMKKLDEL